MTAIGETLRRERQRQNLALDTISRELKISARMLQAIEDEKFERLPGGVFTKAFVRQYAHYLGLDEEDMANEVQRMLQPANDVPQFAGASRPAAPDPVQLPRVEEWENVGESHSQWSSSSLAALALVVVVMMACAGIYSWWQRERHTRPTAPAEIAATHPNTPVPSATPAPQQPDASAPAAPPVQASTTEAAPTAPATAAAVPAAPATADRTDAPPATETTAAAKPAATATPLAGTAPANPNAPVRVELVAAEPVWVLARSDGKYLFSGTIEANQTRLVEANSTVTLRLGNAGGVNITLNGKPIGAVGPKGQVRTVQLTSGGFEIVAAPKPPAAPEVPLR